MTSSPTLLACPFCNGLIQFSHPDTTLLQCSCGTVLNRKEDGLPLAKSYYTILNPSDLIQPGTTGVWHGTGFRVLGRIRAWFDESVCNYWTILFDTGELAWLGEGYGLYSILKPTKAEDAITSHSLTQLKIGESRNWKVNKAFYLERRQQCDKWELQGEMWLPERNDTFRLFEASSTNGTHLALFELMRNFIVPFEVTYTSFAELRLKDTNTASLAGRKFACKKCSTEIAVTTYPYAQSCTCGNCGAQHKLEDGAFKATGHFNKTDTQPAIELGTKGIIRGISYSVIGYTLKQENNKYASQWREYVLHNREEGYAFLSEYNGHWIYVRERGDTPVLTTNHPKSFSYNNEPYQLFNHYHYSVINAQGEFPYNVFNVGDTDVKEFISPPEIWIREANRTEGVSWFQGEHIEGKEVADAFNMAAGILYKTGVGAVEPKGFLSPYKIVAMGFVGCLLLILLHVAIGSTKQYRVVLDETFFLNDSTRNVNKVTPQFVLDKKSSNLQLDVQAPVDNSWFSLQATLINAKTGTEYGVEQGVEYYHGYEDGSSWSEGGRSETAYLTKIPAGTYFLKLEGQAETNFNVVSPVRDFHLKATYDVQNHRNLLFAILLLLVWPVGKYLQVHHSEKARWESSPFSPYTYED